MSTEATATGRIHSFDKLGQFRKPRLTRRVKGTGLIHAHRLLLNDHEGHCTRRPRRRKHEPLPSRRTWLTPTGVRMLQAGHHLLDLGINKPIRLSDLVEQAHTTDRTGRTALAELEAQGYGRRIKGKRGKATAREVMFEFNPNHPSRVSVADAVAYEAKRRKVRVSNHFQNGNYFRHITHASPSEKLFEKNSIQNPDPHQRTGVTPEPGAIGLASNIEFPKAARKRPPSLTPTQQALVEALVEAAPEVIEAAAGVVVAGVPAEVAEAVVEAGSGFLRSLLDGMPSHIAAPHAALLSRLRSGNWRADLIRGARAWRAARPTPTEALCRAHAAWTALRAARPAEEAAGYLVHTDREAEALTAILDLAEAQLGGHAIALRESIQQDLFALGEREETLSWRRRRRRMWVFAVSEATGLDLGGAL